MIAYQMKIYEAEEGGYWAEFPDLGCATQGDTLEELRWMARDLLSLYLEDARDPKWKIPEAKTYKGKQYEWVTPFEDVAIPLMIRQARLKNNIGQRKLAKLLDMSVQQLQKLETPRKSNPTVRTLAAISRALGETLEIKLAA